MSRLKRIAMAGSDIAVTDAEIADLVLEFALQLGRVGTTATVSVPIARNGRAETASILLGPASQITVMDNDDDLLDIIELPDVPPTRASLQDSIKRITGQRIVSDDDESAESEDAARFPSFDEYLD